MKRRYSSSILLGSNLLTAALMWILLRHDDHSKSPHTGPKSPPATTHRQDSLPHLPQIGGGAVGVERDRDNRDPNAELVGIARNVLRRRTFAFTMGFSSNVSAIVQRQFELSAAEVTELNDIMEDSVDKIKTIEQSIAQRREGPDGQYVHIPAAAQLVSPIVENLERQILQAIGETKGRLLLPSVKDSATFMGLLSQAQNIYVEDLVGEDNIVRHYLTKKWVKPDGTESDGSKHLIDGTEIAERFDHLFDRARE